MEPAQPPLIGLGIELTDDEVLGLAGLTGRRWRVVTPTVDITDQADRATATARGVRALAVRGLIAAVDGDIAWGTALEHVVAAALDGDVLVSMFGCSTNLEFDRAGITLAAFRAESGSCLVDSVTAEGVHTVVSHTAASAQAVVAEALALSTDGGGSGPPAACVLLAGDATARKQVYRFAGGQIGMAGLGDVETTAEPGTVLGLVSRLAFDTALGQVFAAR